jgi:hypothetical protein
VFAWENQGLPISSHLQPILESTARRHLVTHRFALA